MDSKVDQVIRSPNLSQRLPLPGSDIEPKDLASPSVIVMATGCDQSNDHRIWDPPPFFVITASHMPVFVLWSMTVPTYARCDSAISSRGPHQNQLIAPARFSGALLLHGIQRCVGVFVQAKIDISPGKMREFLHLFVWKRENPKL
jgi:hypothetical protein